MATYDRTRFWTTHNSYSGKKRGSIPRQLDGGVRCVELDFWARRHGRAVEYLVGHAWPGNEVEMGNGNPNELSLEAWLEGIAEWSRLHPGHHTLTLILDVKSDLTVFEPGGGLDDLNQMLERALGDVFTRDEWDAGGGWPEIGTLDGRILCVLSGAFENRRAYWRCLGQQPSIAVNRQGDVVLAYRSEAADMRCWTGKAKGGRVEWLRRGTYAWSSHTVSEPSLALTDDGWVISVHRLGPAPNSPGPAFLESKVGQLQSDGRIEWSEPQALADGIEPSLALTGPATLTEIHKTPSGKSRRACEGTLDRLKRRVEWQSERPTQDPQFPRDVALWGSHRLTCSTNAARMVFSGFDANPPELVRFPQVMFVEMQEDENPADVGDARFYGAPGSDSAKIAAARNRGQVGRGWSFGRADRVPPPSPPQENMPATDDPFSTWYADYMQKGGQANLARARVTRSRARRGKIRPR